MSSENGDGSGSGDGRGSCGSSGCNYYEKAVRLRCFLFEILILLRWLQEKLEWELEMKFGTLRGPPGTPYERLWRP